MFFVSQSGLVGVPVLCYLVREPAVGSNPLTFVAFDIVHHEVDDFVQSRYLLYVKTLPSLAGAKRGAFLFDLYLLGDLIRQCRSILFRFTFLRDQRVRSFNL